jgi:hypothetical protein
VSDDELFLLLEEEGVEPLDLVVEEPHEGGPLPRDSRVTGSNLTTIDQGFRENRGEFLSYYYELKYAIASDSSCQTSQRRLGFQPNGNMI